MPYAKQRLFNQCQEFKTPKYKAAHTRATELLWSLLKTDIDCRDFLVDKGK